MASSDGKPLVLIVEDEPLLRIYAVDFLGDAGFETLEAADATEAVEILEARLDVRLVFTDIDMPRGIDGLKLAALIRHRWPPIAIVITSGLVIPRAETIPAKSVFVPKPYRAETIVKALWDLAA